MERVSPRAFGVVVLAAPSDREKTQLCVQRYIQHFPAAGEIVIFDRSWYNRAGLEYVMGFCTKDQCKAFVENCPKFGCHIVKSGIILVKFWLEVGQEEQQRPFEARIEDPLPQETHQDTIKLPKRETKGEYDDQTPHEGRNFVLERY